MSHFTVMVCLDKGVDLSRDEKGDRPALTFALDQVLHRFDENRSVESYRVPFDGGIDDFYWVRRAREDRDHYVHGTGLKDYKRGFRGWSNTVSGKTHDEQRAEQLEWKQWADLLDNIREHTGQLTWMDVISNYEVWRKRQPYPENEEEYFVDEETGRPYQLSNYNPQSKWDWWTIGGRWAGKFHVKEPFEMEDVLFADKGHWSAPSYDDWDGRIDGGRIKYVDLERSRVEAGEKALARHRKYHAIREEHGEGYRPWSHFTGRVEAEEITIEEARIAYREQPLKKALNEVEEFRFWWGDLDDEMGIDEDEYVATARNGAVTCYSMVTKAGVWMEPGKMGWFGVSSDTPQSREAYNVEANTYLNSLDPDDVIVVIDCHI